MCGIVGYINRDKAFTKKYAQFLRQAIHCDTLRGHHGTGVLGVNSKGDVKIYKRDLAGPDFLELSKAKDIVDSPDNIIAVAHNRWATRGTSSNENSHPFQHGDTTLFHNGTISNYRTLTTKNFDVDSDAAAYVLEQNSTDYAKGLEQLTGGYSLVFYNEFESTINFARNDEKPMFILKVKDGNSILFGSELGMLLWLAERNGIEVEEHFSTKPGVLLSIPLDSNEKAKASKFNIKKENVVYTHHPYYNTSKHNKFKYSYAEDLDVIVTANLWSPYNNTTKMDDTQNGYLLCTSERFPGLKLTVSSVERGKGVSLLTKQIKVKITSVASNDAAYCKYISEVSSEDTTKIKGPRGKMISLSKFKELTSDGCCMCTDNLNETNTTFDDLENAYCNDCAGEYGLTTKEEMIA